MEGRHARLSTRRALSRTSTRLAESLASANSKTSGDTSTVAQAVLPFSPIETFADVDAVAFRRRHDCAVSRCTSVRSAERRWNAPPADATDLVSRVRALRDLRERPADEADRRGLRTRTRSDIAYVEQKAQGAVRLPSDPGRSLSSHPSTVEGISSARQQLLRAGTGRQTYAESIDIFRSDRPLTALDQQGPRSLAHCGRVSVSDVAALDRYIAWVVRFRPSSFNIVCPRTRLIWRRLPVSTQRRFERFRSRQRKQPNAAETLNRAVGWPESYLTETHVLGPGRPNDSFARSTGAGPQWAAFEEARQSVRRGLAADLLPMVLDGRLHSGDLPSAFRRAFWMKWLSTGSRGQAPADQVQFADP